MIKIFIQDDYISIMFHITFKNLAILYVCDVELIFGYINGISIYSYNTIKSSIQGGNSKKPLGPSMHMFAAADAGVLTLLMTNPIWVVKTRLCLQYAEDVKLAESKRYRGMVDALKKIYKTEGIRGLYKVNKHFRNQILR